MHIIFTNKNAPANWGRALAAPQNSYITPPFNIKTQNLT